MVDIKDDKNDGFLFALRVNKQLHEMAVDTEQVHPACCLCSWHLISPQERTNWVVEVIKLRPVPYIIGLLDDPVLAYYAAFALGNLASHFGLPPSPLPSFIPLLIVPDDARIRIVREAGHTRLYQYLQSSGTSDEGLHDMTYYAFSKIASLGSLSLVLTHCRP